MTVKPHDFYQRQISLTELGLKGQDKISAASVVVIGCGGLGSTAATFLAGSGVGALHLVDFDQVHISNLHRQVFYQSKDIDRNKAEVLSLYLQDLNPLIQVSYSSRYLDKGTVFEEIERGDFVLDCTDHLWTKYLLNDACVLMQKTLIYASLYKFTGYVATFNAADGNQRTGNLRDVFPTFPKAHIPNCAEMGTLNPIVGFIGILQANEVLKLITGLGRVLTNKLLIYNSLDNTQHQIKFQPSIGIEAIRSIYEKTSYQDKIQVEQDPRLLIDMKGLHLLMKKERNPQIISVIEDISTSLPFEVTAKIPLSNFEILERYIDEKIDKNRVVVLVCKRGISSYKATSKLKQLNPKLSVFSLTNGINHYECDNH